MNKRGKKLRLERLNDPTCRCCNLYRSSKHVCILGRGSPTARIMLIGEAPGSAEEKTGKPFMGRAGKFLDSILKSLDMQSLVYITNAVRCRPPENRDPTEKELGACRYYLDKEIDIVKPTVIVLMGRTAIKAMGFGADVNAGSDYFFCSPWPNAYIKGTWHPAYCLRKHGSATKDLVNALRWARQRSMIKIKGD